jgi:hypothetical protein
VKGFFLYQLEDANSDAQDYTRISNNLFFKQMLQTIVVMKPRSNCDDVTVKLWNFACLFPLNLYVHGG